MLHLYNNQVGHDRVALGFPSVKACNAIVFQTSAAIIGLHNFGGDTPTQYEQRADAFLRYVQSTNIAYQGTGKHLYSVIHGTHRYVDDNKYNEYWENEVKAFARLLRYRGPIHLVRVVKHIPDKNTTEGIYIQYNVNKVLGGCSISYKRWTKMAPIATERKPQHGDLKELARTSPHQYGVGEPTDMVGWVGFGTGTTLHSTSFGNAQSRTVYWK